MIAPAALGIISPLVVGFVLGVNGVVGLLAGALVSGFQTHLARKHFFSLFKIFRNTE